MHVNVIIFIIVMKNVCATRSPAVTTCWSVINVVPLACASQGTAVSLAVASDDLQEQEVVMSEVAQTPHRTPAIPSLSDEVHLQILSIPVRRLWY